MSLRGFGGEVRTLLLATMGEVKDMAAKIIRSSLGVDGSVVVEKVGDPLPSEWVM